MLNEVRSTKRGLGFCKDVLAHLEGATQQRISSGLFVSVSQTHKQIRIFSRKLESLSILIWSSQHKKKAQSTFEMKLFELCAETWSSYYQSQDQKLQKYADLCCDTVLYFNIILWYYNKSTKPSQITVNPVSWRDNALVKFWSGLGTNWLGQV